MEWISKAAWRGCSAGLMRSAVTSTFMFLGFEKIKKAINGLMLEEDDN